MAESTTSVGKRARRSTATSRQLEAARERLAHQLTEEREREERIKQALRDYMTAGEKIAVAEQGCEEKVAELEKRIARVREQAREKVAGAHAQQGRSALAMHEAGRTVEQVADLLAVSEKKARQLIAAGRDADGQSVAPPHNGQAPGTAREPRPAAREATGSGTAADAAPARSGEQGDLRGVDAHQDGPDAGLVPAVPHGGSQGA